MTPDDRHHDHHDRHPTHTPPPGSGGSRLSRRTFLIGLAAVGAAACEVGRPGPPDRAAAPSPTPSAASPTTTPTPTPTPTPMPTPTPTTPPVALPAAPEYEPDSLDIRPEAKRIAGNVAQALGTYEAGEPAERRLARAAPNMAEGLDADVLALASAPLYMHGSAASARVVAAQLGGLHPFADPEQCSVMVILEQRLVAGSRSRTVVRTLDVRLRDLDGEWVFDRLASAGGDPVARPNDLSPAAQAVLDDERIDLPDSARWDLHSGEIDERLLSVMLQMAERSPYGVTCLRNGHPLRVFGTDRLSNHTASRAVDIWSVDGEPVFRQQPERSGPAWMLTRRIFEETEVSELGAPWALDAFGGRSFTNEVHLDHLHVAFEHAPEPPSATEATPEPDR